MTVMLCGAAVMAGWIGDIGLLKSLSPGWISMKVDTAFAFVLSGIILYFIVRTAAGKPDIAQVAISITSLLLILLMGILFFSTLLGVHTGAEELFIKDTSIDRNTVVPGRPSIPTMINFILIGAAGLITLLTPDRLWRVKSIGFVISVIGAIALVGYLFQAPLLYYYVEGINSAIAFHTAALFVLVGAGFLCL